MPGVNALLQNRYRIERLLGKGGMGAVYLAEDEQYGRKVALKEALFDDPVLRKAFRREARLLEHLNHPVLPRVKGYFTEEGRQYLVMQFIDGEHLDRLLEERIQAGLGPFAVDKVLQWAYQLLDALEYLHGHRPPVVHRDIKPLNLKLTPRGEIFLLDFGLAKGAPAEMSHAGSLLGYSPHYAPLEQMDGRGTDPRTDLYSLAATLYRLLTGQLPPSAASRAATVSEGQPDPLRPADELNPQVPTAVAAALMRALSLNPNKRPPSATAMKIALREASQSRMPISGGSAGLSEAPQPESELLPTLRQDPRLNPMRPAIAGAATGAYNGAVESSAVSSPLIPTTFVDTGPPGPANHPLVTQLLVPNPFWFILSALFLALASALAFVISRRFLGESPDVTGVVVTLSLGLLCLLAGRTFIKSGRHWVERGCYRFGIRLSVQGEWRAALTLITLLVVCVLYFSLPAIARRYNERAVRLQQAGDLRMAIRNYERAISLDPDFAVARYNASSAYEDVLEFDKALDGYQTALRADPRFYASYNNLARLYLVRRKDFAGALKVLNAGLELKPTEPQVRYSFYKNRGWANFGLGYYELAAEDLREALKWREDGAAAHCLLAQTLEAQKEKAVARQSWEACLAYAPGEPDVEAVWLSLAEERLRAEE